MSRPGVATSKSSEVVLESGSILWEVHIGDQAERWALAHPYGSLSQPAGTIFLFQRQRYRLERAHTAIFLLSLVFKID